MKPILKFKTSLVALAMVSSAGAFAIPLTGATVTGYSTGYEVSGSTLVGTIYSTGAVPTATLDSLLGGSALSPTGNLELGKLGSGPATILDGYFGTTHVTFSSLTAADWTTALASQYISAAAASIGATLTSTQVTQAAAFFLAGNNWKRVSDPNISYATLDDGLLSIGLAGFFNAAPILAQLFPNYAVPAGSQASEVVKVTVNNGPAQYLFSFKATQSGLVAADDGLSYTGNYNVTLAVPEPGSIALLGLGLAGLALTRRRKTKQAA